MVDWSVAAGTLSVSPALERPELLAEPVLASLRRLSAPERIGVAEIDPEYADTAEFCEHYSSPVERSANCVVVSGKRSGEVRHAACLLPATTRIDVNNTVKRRLDVRKASFAATEDAVRLSGMAYGGITPFGLPEEWPILVDGAISRTGVVVVGSGTRVGKLLLDAELLSELPGTEIVEQLGN